MRSDYVKRALTYISVFIGFNRMEKNGNMKEMTTQMNVEEKGLAHWQ